MTNCAEFEVLLADAIDDVLTAQGRESFNRHMESCPACAELARDAMSAVSFMDRAAEIEPPPALMTKIIHATNEGWELTLHGRGLRGWINRTFAPVLQPRFVLGAVFTLMSATMLMQCGGAPKGTLTAADLDPVRIWTALENRTERIYDRAVQSYESMRLIYQVRNQLAEWSEQQRQEEETQRQQDDSATDSRTKARQLPPTTQQNEPISPQDSRK